MSFKLKVKNKKDICYVYWELTVPYHVFICNLYYLLKYVSCLDIALLFILIFVDSNVIKKKINDFSKHDFLKWEMLIKSCRVTNQ